MFIKQLYTNCLAHAAYYIECGGEAAVIDPLRNPEPYISLAHERGAHIKYVLETHFHADFVSGHIDLANETGATIVFGPQAAAGYKVYVAEDGERLPLGKAHLQVLPTPGHTIESACFLLVDEHDKPCAVFTGDTLFVGDVGRPDLLSGNLPKEQLAGMLYESLTQKIAVLPDDVIVYPGHGAGSACGKNIGKESFSTIGREKMFNYAMASQDKDAFVKAVTTDLPAIPGYFFTDATMNRQGASPYAAVIEHGHVALGVNEFDAHKKDGATVLDTRDPEEFAAGYIPGSVNIGLNGDFAVWVGTIIKPGSPIVLVCDPGKEAETIERLARIGFDSVIGFLDGGIKSWFAAGYGYYQVPVLDSREMASLLESGVYSLLDVRNRREVAKNRIPGSVHIPLNQLADKWTSLPMHAQWLVYCAGGYRSMIAASFLKSKGFPVVASLEGGINAALKHAPAVVDIEEMDMDVVR